MDKSRVGDGPPSSTIHGKMNEKGSSSFMLHINVLVILVLPVLPALFVSGVVGGSEVAVATAITKKHRGTEGQAVLLPQRWFNGPCISHGELPASKTRKTCGPSTFQYNA